MEKVMANELPIIKEEDKALVEKLRTLIEAAKHKVAVTVNSAMTMLYWEIGTYINSYILDNKRAEYGKQIVVSLSRQLQQEYGTNFSEKNLRRMMQFAERFPEKGIVVSLIRQLTWTHIIALIPLEDELKRNFYIEMCQMELYLNWLKKNEMVEGENQPIGLILCAGKNEEHIELMHLEESNIRVAEYLVKLPDRNVLENKLQMAIERAKHRLASSANTVD